MKLYFVSHKAVILSWIIYKYSNLVANIRSVSEESSYTVGQTFGKTKQSEPDCHASLALSHILPPKTQLNNVWCC